MNTQVIDAVIKEQVKQLKVPRLGEAMLPLPVRRERVGGHTRSSYENFWMKS